jgi:hypothetical protein
MKGRTIAKQRGKLNRKTPKQASEETNKNHSNDRMKTETARTD